MTNINRINVVLENNNYRILSFCTPCLIPSQKKFFYFKKIPNYAAIKKFLVSQKLSLKTIGNHGNFCL